jgi:nicotinamide mononucleotide transporter
VTVPELLSLIVGCGSAVSMFLAIRGNSAGWAVVIVAQSSFVAYAVATQQWLFFGQLACLAMGIYGFWRWRRKGVHRDPATPRRQRVPATPGRQRVPGSEWPGLGYVTGLDVPIVPASKPPTEPPGGPSSPAATRPARPGAVRSDEHGAFGWPQLGDVPERESAGELDTPMERG